MAIRDACCVYNKLPDVVESTVDDDGIRFFCTTAANTVLVRPRLLGGVRAAYIAVEDVCLLVTDACDGHLIHVHAQIQLDSVHGNIRIAYAFDVDAGPVPKEIRMRVHVCGVLLVDVTWQFIFRLAFT